MNWLVSYGYDYANRLTSVQYTSGSQVSSETRTLDPSGNTTNIAFSVPQFGGQATQAWNIGHVWDAASRLSTLTDTQGSAVHTAQYQYTANGDVSSITVGTAQVTYTYDPDGRVLQVIGESGGHQLLNKTNTYDADGNLTNVQNGGVSQTYAYDSQDQLVSADGWTYGTVMTYQYDAEGNRLNTITTKVTTTTLVNCPGGVIDPTCLWNPILRKMVCECTPETTTSTETTNFTYDAIGNLLSDGTRTYTWNAADQLSSVTENGTTYNYSYDGLGRRIGANGDAVYYYGTSNQIAYVADANDNVLFRISYDQGGTPQFITVYVNGSPLTYAYVYDGLGNVVGLIDDNAAAATYGQYVVAYNYDAWGNVTVSYDTSGIGLAKTNPFTYKGYWFDWSTGLYYLNARYYNPAWGRFISPDPAGLTPGDASSYNAYEYAANNPLTVSDPTGEMHQEGGGPRVGGPPSSGGQSGSNGSNGSNGSGGGDSGASGSGASGGGSTAQEVSNALSGLSVPASGVAVGCGGWALVTVAAPESGAPEGATACVAAADGIAFGSGVAVFGIDGYLAYSGHGSWTQFVADGVALAFGGAGWAKFRGVDEQVLRILAQKVSLITWGWNLSHR